MLQSIHIKDIGPASEMKLDFGERINIITGDNGLGKSFLLDAIWKALTGAWANHPLWADKRSGRPHIEWVLRNGEKGHTEKYLKELVDDSPPIGVVVDSFSSKPAKALVIYAQVDGNFSVWDPHRNFVFPIPQVLSNKFVHQPIPQYAFSAQEVWEGLPLDKPDKLCMGLIHDWVLWQNSDELRFQIFSKVLEILSESQTEQLKASKKTIKLSYNDVRPIPLLEAPYGDVPIVFASAAIKRILSLAYLLVWAWAEHKDFCQIFEESPVEDIIFIIDEPETHLHPQWQRRILPSILKVTEILGQDKNVRTQLITTTHSPIILSSCETMADKEKDTLYNLELVGGDVKLIQEEWEVRGDICKWLTTDIFDFKQPRSIEAETAVLKVMDRMTHQMPLSAQEIEQIEASLRAVLGDIDPFWTRWQYYLENLRKA
jgi:hypothetical protein